MCKRESELRPEQRTRLYLKTSIFNSNYLAYTLGFPISSRLSQANCRSLSGSIFIVLEKKRVTHGDRSRIVIISYHNVYQHYINKLYIVYLLLRIYLSIRYFIIHWIHTSFRLCQVFYFCFLLFFVEHVLFQFDRLPFCGI